MQHGLKHNQCLLLVSTSSIPVSRSPSRSLPSDQLYRYQLLLTTKLGELVAFLRNCLASIYKRIYTIICLKSVCLATFADCRSQFLLDRLGRCLKLIVSSGSTSCHEFASQFGLAFFLYAKNIHKLSRMPSLAHMAVE